jgi:periplasmic protein TonB
MPASDSDLPVPRGRPLADLGPTPVDGAADYGDPEFFEALLADGPDTVCVSYPAMRDLRRALAGTSADVLGLVFGAYTPSGPRIERFEPLPHPSGDDPDWLPRVLAPHLDDLGDLPSPMGFFRARIGADDPAPPPGRKSGKAGFPGPGQTPFRAITAAGAPGGAPRQGRGDPGSGLQMTGQDCDLVRRYLPRLPFHRGVFLVIHGAVNGPWSAALFALDAGWVPLERTPALVFAFDECFESGIRNRYANDSPPGTGQESRQLVPAARQDVAATRYDAPATESREISTELRNVPEALGNGRRAGLDATWITLAAWITILIAGGLGTYKWLHPGNGDGSAQTDRLTSGPLALRVSHSGADFEVSWNRSSRAVLEASRGTLTIHDGDITRTVEFDGPQLREGKVLYSPLYTELSFRLEVAAGDSAPVAESVQVVTWDTPVGVRPASSAPDPLAPDRLEQRNVPPATGSNALPQTALPERGPQPVIPSGPDLNAHSAGTIARNPARPVPSPAAVTDPSAHAASTSARNPARTLPSPAAAIRPVGSQAAAPLPASRAAGSTVILGNPGPRIPPAVPPNTPEQEPRRIQAQPAAQAAVQRPSQGADPAGPAASAPEPRVPAAAVSRNESPKAAEVVAAKEVQPSPPISAAVPATPQVPAARPPAPVSTPVIPPPAKQTPAPLVLEVGGNAQAAKLLKMVQPVYPSAAMSSRIQGVVRFRATIGKDGSVRDLQLVSGNLLLVESARNAVKQWVYRPTLLNGQPMEVTAQVDVQFTLNR